MKFVYALSNAHLGSSAVNEIEMMSPFDEAFISLQLESPFLGLVIRCVMRSIITLMAGVCLFRNLMGGNDQAWAQNGNNLRI